VVVVRVSEHRPSRAQPLEEVRDQALEALTRERAEEALEESARELLDAARSKGELESLAAAAGAEWRAAEKIGRTGSQTEPGIVRAAFQMPAPGAGAPVFDEVALDSDRRAVIQLSSVVPGDPSEVDSTVRDNLRLALARQYGASESQAMLRALRDRAEITVFADRL